MTTQLKAYVEALREFEYAHKNWMEFGTEATKQYKNSQTARYIQARRDWERAKTKERP